MKDGNECCHFTNMAVLRRDHGGANYEVVPSSGDENYHRFRLKWNGSDVQGWLDSSTASASGGNTAASQKIQLAPQGSGTSIEADWVFVRKYAGPEPNWST